MYAEKFLRDHPEIMEILKAVKYAIIRDIPLKESKLVGIARYMNSKYIKKGTHLKKAVRETAGILIRKGDKYTLTNLGRELLSTVSIKGYEFVPLKLRYKN